MILDSRRYLKQFSIVVVAIVAIHFLLYRAFIAEIDMRLTTLGELYLFLVILSVLHFYAIYTLFRKWPKYAGFIFTGLSFLKMGVSILFLLPFVKPLNALSIVIALNFMGVYFIFLAFEVIFIAKSMGKNH